MQRLNEVIDGRCGDRTSVDRDQFARAAFEVAKAQGAALAQVQTQQDAVAVVIG